jgi:hypothetical protein
LTIRVGTKHATCATSLCLSDHLGSGLNRIDFTVMLRNLVQHERNFYIIRFISFQFVDNAISVESVKAWEDEEFFFKD